MKVIADLTSNDINIRLIRFQTEDSNTTYALYIIKNDKCIIETYGLTPAEAREDFLNYQEIFFGEILQRGLIGGIRHSQIGRMQKITKNKLGNILVDNDFITKANLQNALNVQEITNEPIGMILIQSNIITKKDLILALNLQKIRRKK